MVSAAAVLAADLGHGGIVGVVGLTDAELVQQVSVGEELLDETVMNGAEPIEPIIEPGHITAGTRDLVAQLFEQPADHLVGGHRFRRPVLWPGRGGWPGR